MAPFAHFCIFEIFWSTKHEPFSWWFSIVEMIDIIQGLWKFPDTPKSSIFVQYIQTNSKNTLNNPISWIHFSMQDPLFPVCIGNIMKIFFVPKCNCYICSIYGYMIFSNGWYFFEYIFHFIRKWCPLFVILLIIFFLFEWIF